MKVLLIDVNYKTSSTGQIVYSLFSFARNHGHEAYVCYGRGRRVHKHSVYKFGLGFETCLDAALSRITGYIGSFSFFSTKRLIRYIAKVKPDIIHIHELHAYFLNLYMLLDYLSSVNIPVIHTLHCEFSYTGKCGYSMGCTKWQENCGNCPNLTSYPATFFFDHTEEMFLRKKQAFSRIQNLVITTPSKWLTERARQSFFKDRRIETIYNGVDTSVFHYTPRPELRAELGIHPNDKIVVAVAPNIMSDRKGGNQVIKIANELLGQHVFFILIGNRGPVEVKNNYILLPAIYDKSILAGYYSEADYFVLCSKKETFSMTCAEALCCGTPIIGYKCGAPEDIFPYPYASFFEYGDYKAVAREILRSNRKTRLDVSEFGRTVFSSDTMAKRYYELYEAVDKHKSLI